MGRCLIIKKHLFIGPLPPEYGGTSILFENLISDLKCSVNDDILVVNTNINKNKFYRLLYILFGTIKKINKVTHIHLHCSTPTLKYIFPLIFCIAKIFNKKIFMRKFGGDFYNYNHKSIIFKILIHLLKKTDHVFFETLREVDLIKSYKIKNISWYPNPREKKDFNINIKNKFSHKIIFIGFVTKEKGMDDLIDSLELIKNDIYLDIVGKCDDSEILYKISNSKKINYLGIKNPKYLKENLSKYDLLCLPTYYPGEGYPGVIVESFMSGVPVLSTYWNAIPEIVKHNENGLLVDIKSPSQIALQIDKIYNNFDLFKSLSTHALKSSSLFDSKQLFNKYLSKTKIT